MKKFLLALSSFFPVFSSISQNLNQADHQGIDASGEMVAINSRVYYLHKTENNCCTGVISLVCRDEFGQKVFGTSFGSYPINSFGKLIKTNDNALLISYNSLGSCDTGPNPEYIVKMDTNGTVIFRTAIGGISNGFLTPKIAGITQHIDSSYYLVYSSDLYHYSRSGQFISKIPTGVSSISCIKALSNGNLLINGNVNSTRQNVIVTTSGSIVTQQSSSNVINKFIETSTTFIGRTSNGLIETYNSSLTLQNVFTPSAATLGNYVNDFDFRNDSLFVVGSNGASVFYAILDSNLSIVYQTVSNQEIITPTGIAVSNKINIVTTARSKSNINYPYTGFYKLNLTGTFGASSDIGITGFSNINTKLLGYASGSSILTPAINLDVTVKNYGIDTVKSFFINYYAYLNSGISWCYTLLHKKCVTPIGPGATISVPTGTFYGQPFYINPPGSTINNTKLGMCLFTTIPNGKTDTETNNDAYCDSVYFSITGIEDEILNSEMFKIFPNPFSDHLSIQSEMTIKKISIVDGLGKTMNIIYPDSKTFSCKTLAFKPGFYLIRLETDKGVLTKKLINY